MSPLICKPAAEDVVTKLVFASVTVLSLGVPMSNTLPRTNIKSIVSADDNVPLLGKSVKDYSNDTWTHTDTNISSEDSRVQAVANAIWTDSVKTAFKSFREAQPDI